MNNAVRDTRDTRAEVLVPATRAVAPAPAWPVAPVPAIRIVVLAPARPVAVRVRAEAT